MEKIGLIAGSGRFPILFAQQARKKGVGIIAIAVRGETPGRLKYYADKIFWLKLCEFKDLYAIFKKENVNKAAMAGQINPQRLFKKRDELGPELKEILTNIRDKKADTIFGAISDKLKENGIELISSLSYLGDYLPGEGVLTVNSPSEQQWGDIRFGLDMAKKIAGLDIGQTVVVKDKAITAVEALEGTDRAILRGGAIARSGATVVKVNKPKQDERFDVPVIGLRTIKALLRAKISCLAIEKGKTVILDKDEVIKQANKRGICIVAV